MTSSDKVEHGPGSRLASSEAASTPVSGSPERRGGGSGAQAGTQAVPVARSVATDGEVPTYPQSDHAAGRCDCGRRHDLPAEPDAPRDEATFGDQLRAEGKLCHCGFLHVACDPQQRACEDRHRADGITNQQWTQAASAVDEAVWRQRYAEALQQAFYGPASTQWERMADAARTVAVEEWNPVCGRLAMGHQEVIDRLRDQLAEMTTTAKVNYGLHKAAHEEAETHATERDDARGIAVELENQLAAVRDYLRHSDDDGIRTRETVLRMITDPAATEETP